MTRKILWMLLSFLLVAALVLASCAKEEVVVEEEEEEEEGVVEEEEEEEEVEEVVVPPVGEPIYGGTVIHFLWDATAPSADHAVGGWPDMQNTSPVIEFLIMGDAEKYGARGTGEYSFVTDSTPVEYSKGAIAESWEITPERDKLIFHIRPGIIWAAYGKEHVMEPRELTAEDVAWSLNRGIDSPMMGGWMRTENGGWIDSIYDEDDTVVVETSKFVPLSIDWRPLAHGWAMGIYAPEVVAAGASDWDNLVGTGPFMLKEHVAGSHISYARNPHYWDTTTINGKEYPIPFIDELLYAQVVDESTRVAALRTGVMDVWYTVPLVYGDTLARINPELIQQYWSMESMECLVMRTDRPPFDNHEVRRAMMIALDLPAISRARYGEWVLRGWPADATTAAYTPFEELPARTQELYDYDSVKARQMLADAGYPDGFRFEIVLPSYDEVIDYVTMAVAYWADIGVEATMKVMEPGAYYVAEEAGEYAMIPGFARTVHVLGALGEFVPPNVAFYDNPEFTALFEEAEEKRTEAEQNPILKELAVTALDSVAWIPLHVGDMGITAWWPWLKNFYGEFAIADWAPSYAISTAWIDQDLKAEMGY